jgi:hypothetical protein
MDVIERWEAEIGVWGGVRVMVWAGGEVLCVVDGEVIRCELLWG